LTPIQLLSNRHLLIERARIRNNYARPWGISIPLKRNDNDDGSSEDSIDIEKDSHISTSVDKESRTKVKHLKSSPKKIKNDVSKDVKIKPILVSSKSHFKDFNDSDSEGEDD